MIPVFLFLCGNLIGYFFFFDYRPTIFILSNERNVNYASIYMKTYLKIDARQQAPEQQSLCSIKIYIS